MRQLRPEGVHVPPSHMPLVDIRLLRLCLARVRMMVSHSEASLSRTQTQRASMAYWDAVFSGFSACVVYFVFVHDHGPRTSESRMSLESSKHYGRV
ncbi:hypothetical protein L226DRAFT_397035 [Lentinus tigrinus ALCF2SS1-7]|uniref:Uncharacterized protein n=1 Tax=Lentinus tigrinus ALCF2SS1-6 TaxID=1328759 RepID=A0A5C2SEG3_9APHY|nr:hypothetical protein L227DRAFT_56335 [Lentinus tigrinus ALCF2SS1-6]RPD76113.1 hypothetical protein L226DRAFT_397035 [Lentinus tigrinus ALCF2SS1-7]